MKSCRGHFFLSFWGNYCGDFQRNVKYVAWKWRSCHPEVCGPVGWCVSAARVRSSGVYTLHVMVMVEGGGCKNQCWCRVVTAGLQCTGLLSSADSSPSNSTVGRCFSNPSYRTLGPCTYAAHYAKPDKRSSAKVGLRTFYLKLISWIIVLFACDIMYMPACSCLHQTIFCWARLDGGVLCEGFGFSATLYTFSRGSP